jgi:hypothetical protein
VGRRRRRCQTIVVVVVAVVRQKAKLFCKRPVVSGVASMGGFPWLPRSMVMPE